MTEHEAALAANGAEQAQLLIATVDVTTFLWTHTGMPPLGSDHMTWSFSMPQGDDAKLDRLASIAAWLNVEPVNRDGSFMAYRDFGAIRFGGHFTPDHIRRERARDLFRGIE